MRFSCPAGALWLSEQRQQAYGSHLRSPPRSTARGGAPTGGSASCKHWLGSPPPKTLTYAALVYGSVRRYSCLSSSATVQWPQSKLRQRLHSWRPIDSTKPPIPRK